MRSEFGWSTTFGYQTSSMNVGKKYLQVALTRTVVTSFCMQLMTMRPWGVWTDTPHCRVIIYCMQNDVTTVRVSATWKYFLPTFILLNGILFLFFYFQFPANTHTRKYRLNEKRSHANSACAGWRLVAPKVGYLLLKYECLGDFIRFREMIFRSSYQEFSNKNDLKFIVRFAFKVCYIRTYMREYTLTKNQWCQK